MAAFSTYADLQASIIRYAMRGGDTEFAQQVPGFIALTETRVNRTLRVSDMEQSATGDTDTGGFADLPTDFLELRSVSSGQPYRPALKWKAPDAAVGEYCASGPSIAFSMIGPQIRIYPGGIGPVIIDYYAQIPPLSDANPTNWLLQKAPDVYLCGALLEAALFMEDDARAQVWLTYFDRAIADLKASDVSSRFAYGVSRVQGWRP
jgi:hypothetical protein